MKNIKEGDKECNVIQLKHLSNDEILLIKYFNEKRKYSTKDIIKLLRISEYLINNEIFQYSINI